MLTYKEVKLLVQLARAGRSKVSNGGMRPYEELMITANEAGRVLRREHIYCSGPPVDNLSNEVQAIVQEHCSAKSVVDLGAGCGALQQYLQPGVFYLGVELNPGAIELAMKKRRNVMRGDITATGLKDNSFDVCVMIEVLEHIPEYERALAEAHRICTSKLVMTVPNIAVLPIMSDMHVVPWHILEATHVNFFTPAVLEKLLQRFFRRVQVWEIHEWLRPGLHMNIAAVAWK